MEYYSGDNFLLKQVIFKEGILDTPLLALPEFKAGGHELHNVTGVLHE